MEKTRSGLQSRAVWLGIVATLACLAALLAERAHASGQEGHGGNAIVCFKDAKIVTEILGLPLERRAIPNSALKEITSIEALDLYEARKSIGGLDSIGSSSEKGVPLFRTRKGESNTEFLHRMAERFADAIPILSIEIEDGIRKLAEHTSVYGEDSETVGIAQAFDVGQLDYVINSRSCLVATLARQSGLKSKGTLRLDLDGRLMNHPKQSDLSRKTVLLHEMIYAWGREMNQTNSLPTRILVARALRRQLSRNEMVDILTGFGFANPDDPRLYGERRFDPDLQNQIRNIIFPVVQILFTSDFES